MKGDSTLPNVNAYMWPGEPHLVHFGNKHFKLLEEAWKCQRNSNREKAFQSPGSCSEQNQIVLSCHFKDQSETLLIKGLV